MGLPVLSKCGPVVTGDNVIGDMVFSLSIGFVAFPAQLVFMVQYESCWACEPTSLPVQMGTIWIPLAEWLH